MNYVYYFLLVCLVIYLVYYIYTLLFKPTETNINDIRNTPDRLQKIVDSHEQHIKAHKEALGIKEVTSDVAKKLNEQETVTLDFNTGKITLPENFTPEERAEVEAAMKELSQLVNGDFKSLEAFLRENDKSGRGLIMPFTKANELHDNQLQVREEMENHKFDTEHWSDEDFIENLLSYHNQQYKFDGLVQMYHKLNERGELSQDEKKKIREWYVLVSQELVYDV